MTRMRRRIADLRILVTMKLFLLSVLFSGLELLPIVSSGPVARPDTTIRSRVTKHLRPVLERRQSQTTPGFGSGEPIDGTGKGAPLDGEFHQVTFSTSDEDANISFQGGTNAALDLQNPDNLGQQSTDNGLVVNLKWSFSDSKTRLLNGGWVREQVVTDLPSSHDIAAAQQHLTKGSLRELHWHRVVSSISSPDI